MLKTKGELPKYCSKFKDQHGKERVRFRKGAVTAYIKGTPWSDDFMRQRAELLDKAEPLAKVDGKRTKAGTVNALVVSYYRSPEFRSLKPSTQGHRRRILDNFCAERIDKLHTYGDSPLKGLRREHVRQIIADKAEKTPAAANNLKKILNVILNYAVSLDMIDGNPASGIKRYKISSDGFHTWTEDEIAKFEATHRVDTKGGLAFALLLYTGQRVSDVCRMGHQHVGGDAIAVTQEKTGRSLSIPLHPKLKELLASVPRPNMTFLITQYGVPFTAKGLGNFVKKMCVVAGLYPIARPTVFAKLLRDAWPKRDVAPTRSRRSSVTRRSARSNATPGPPIRRNSRGRP
jgi:integrase